ncbi:hypothetical protein BG011_006603 [Mortierella polycephala]|uniref:N-acetyltransferase domain-containing protein n=1 Tax=Mortierella polycephala TaxID=41804 RepID=A0A9P6PVL8_9FUNG|nr:hypothetical protein BG011_006603 [Mortierella polycephala]
MESANNDSSNQPRGNSYSAHIPMAQTSPQLPQPQPIHLRSHLPSSPRSSELTSDEFVEGRTLEQQQQQQQQQNLQRHYSYMNDPLRQSISSQQQQQQHQPSWNHGNPQDPRSSGYRPTSQMQMPPRSPSPDYSQPPGSPLPPYVARPSMAMQPPHYYREIHNETQAAGESPYVDLNDDQIGYAVGRGGGGGGGGGGGSRMHRNDEDLLYQTAGQFNPEAKRGKKKSRFYGDDDDNERKGEIQLMIRNFEKRDQQKVRNLVLDGLTERWGAEFDPSYNQDITDIHDYYIERHHATVAVLEVDTTHQQLQHQNKQLLQEHEQQQQQRKAVVGCGILLPLPAKDVYGTWCAEPPSRVEKLKGLRLCRMIRLSVSKEYRSKGYAKKLIQHLIEVAREQGFDKILVETETLWSSAVRIYKAMGFTVVEEGEETVHFEYDL